MLFGGNRLGPRMWLLATFLVVFGAHFSALWIIMANSWMQTPAGYTVHALPAPARAYMTSFRQVVFTPSFIPHILHVWFASWTAGAALDAQCQRMVFAEEAPYRAGQSQPKSGAGLSSLSLLPRRISSYLVPRKRSK